MTDLNLSSNVGYSTFDLTINYEGLGYVHNNSLYNAFELINRIGEDKTIRRIKEIAISETRLGISSGIYPEGSIEIISSLFDLFEENENDVDRLLIELKNFYGKILSDSKFNNTIILGFANLAFHSIVFWYNFEKDNTQMLRGNDRTVFIGASDLLGGIVAGWKGSRAGASIGAVFGNPVAGILVGGIGGFLLGAVVASGTAYYGSR